MVQAEASGKTCFDIGEAQPIDAERAGWGSVTASRIGKKEPTPFSENGKKEPTPFSENGKKEPTPFSEYGNKEPTSPIIFC